MLEEIKNLIGQIDRSDTDSLIAVINDIRECLHEISPFKNEPVDFVKWVKNDAVYSNDYNPNSVAPPEMELLRVSIASDGYTQPIVTMPDENLRNEVVDGFHRHRVGKECPDIQERVLGYLPVVNIRESQYDKADRMASTIRHNRARGKHRVDAMSDIVIELKRRNWSDEKIAKNLGMEPDEVLRLCQISGISELFQDAEFSKSWDVENIEDSANEFDLDENAPVEIKEGRILHTYEKWECYPAGFYEIHPPEGLTKTDCEEIYANMLRDLDAFSAALYRVINEWPNSCEHYLTNEKMNRIAWLGQASLCIECKIPSTFRGGFNLLTVEQQNAANETALMYLNAWEAARGRELSTMDDAISTSKADIY